MILATQSEYSLIEGAIKKLDLAPRQVLIEAKIASVSLSGSFRLGLNWAFQNGLRIGTGNILTVNPALSATASPYANADVSKFSAGSGFNYAFSNVLNGGSSINLIFNMLAKDDRVRVISTPSMIATDNQKSQIQVGQSVPTPGQFTSVGTQVIGSTQYVNTGVQFSVTPRINAGGQVTLDISVELSDVAAGYAGSASPAFDKTTAQSIITVPSGQTILLGGLIKESSSKDIKGLPFISQIPILGALFGEQGHADTRQELVILITPTLIPANQDLTDVTNELRKKMKYLQEEFPTPKHSDPAGMPKSEGANRK